MGTTTPLVHPVVIATVTPTVPCVELRVLRELLCLCQERVQSCAEWTGFWGTLGLGHHSAE